MRPIIITLIDLPFGKLLKYLKMYTLTDFDSNTKLLNVKVLTPVLFYSTHTSFPLSISSHNKQNKTIRVFEANKSRSCRCSCQGDVTIIK